MQGDCLFSERCTRHIPGVISKGALDTMKYRFAKLHGAGNDFVMIDDMQDAITLTEEQVRAVCDRHFGVGADGVILVKPSPRPECAAYMDYYNSDGTKAQMCGNGVRCFSKFLVDREMIDVSAGSYVADTLAGPKPITFTVDAQGKLQTATVDMGEPILEPEAIPTTLPATPGPHGPAAANALLSIDDDLYSFTCVSMGNPHAVTFLEDPLEFPVETIGPLVECAPEFPEKTNVEFARVDGDTITMRVWERGCGETLACGTGACATAVAACLIGKSGNKVHLKLLGGTLDIHWADDNHVYMTGPAEQSFEGTVRV